MNVFRSVSLVGHHGGHGGFGDNCLMFVRTSYQELIQIEVWPF